MKTAIFYAEKHEEVEALTVVDILRRSGITCDMVSITGEKQVLTSHGVNILTDMLFEDFDPEGYDALILPGGMPGTENLFNYKPLTDILIKYAGDKWLCAICAAPTVFGRLGLLKDKAATCYPGMEDSLNCREVRYDPVVTDGRFITSRGLGTAIPFALAIVENLLSKEDADNMAKRIVFA